MRWAVLWHCFRWKGLIRQEEESKIPNLYISTLFNNASVWLCPVKLACLENFLPIQFSCSVLSYSLWPHGLQHTRPHCPSASPRVFPSSCSLCWWFSPAISSSDALFSFCSQSFPVSETFPMSQFFTSGGQSIGASASALVLPVNIQGWSPFRLTGLISLLAKGPSGVFESTTVQRYQFFGAEPSLWPNSHIHTWLLEKPKLWLYGTFAAEWCLCF